MDCPWGNLSMHTFRKLPVNKPSKVKASINKANFILPILNWIALELMIERETELSNRSELGYSMAYLAGPKYLLFFSRLLAASDAPRRELNLLDLGFHLFCLGAWLFHNLR